MANQVEQSLQRQMILTDLDDYAAKLADDVVQEIGMTPDQDHCELVILDVIKYIGFEAQRHNEASAEPSRARRRLVTYSALEKAGVISGCNELAGSAKLYEGMCIRRAKKRPTPIATLYPA
jgi:hypothetical protein